METVWHMRALGEECRTALPCNDRPHEHRAVVPDASRVTYYGGARWTVSTRMVPTVTVRTWQGTHDWYLTGEKIARYYRADWYNAGRFRALARRPIRIAPGVRDAVIANYTHP